MDLLSQWHSAALSLLPDGIDVWDAHTHTGHNDPDGVSGSPSRLLEKISAADQAGAIVTTNQDPDGYRAANDRILDEAKASDSKLIPFARVDPRRGREAVAEAERSLNAGHRGIKLHPRAEQFRLREPTVLELMQLAAKRKVPVLAHAGRGIPSLGRDAVELLDGVEGLHLILAHAAISDLSWLGPIAADYPRLHFDTAWWDVTDLLALFAWVPPAQILYASDTPYGHPYLGFILTMRVAASAGYTTAQMQALFGGTLWNLLNGQRTTDLGSAAGHNFVPRDPGLLRIFASIQAAIAAAFGGADPQESVALARLACDVPEATRYADTFRAIDETLKAIDLGGRRSQVARPLIVAATAALTPTVLVPDIVSDRGVGTGG